MLLVRDQLSEALDTVTRLSAEAFAAVRQVILEKLWLEFECLNPLLLSQEYAALLVKWSIFKDVATL
jgi:hypothetical protein